MLAISLVIALHATCICSSLDVNNGGSVERMKRQIKFSKRTVPPTSTIHEVIISVKQLNRVSMYFASS